MSGEEFDYPALIHEALIGVVREVLTRVAEDGLPGDHHFYLTFRTDHPEVMMPAGQRMRHPDTMTIILQHQFWNLSVEEEVFGVTLRFGGTKQALTIPFEALTSFIDPDAEFGLQLGAASDDDEEVARGGEADQESAPDESKSAPNKPGEVISIDEFRKKTD
jgi:hypothetical protein